jgi:prepilin-type processing-associated H-X9-DG protein
MDELFIGYLLNALDEPEQRQVEAYLAQHPEARERLDLLEQALAPLAADSEAPTPTPRLVEMTLARVAEHACAPKDGLEDLPQAPPVSRSSVSGGRSWWRRADILVAAAVMLTIIGIGLTVLGSLRAPSSNALTVACKHNLMQYYFALQHYRQQNRQFPDVTSLAPHDVAGMVVPMLAEAGGLKEGTSIRCPGIGEPAMCQLPLESLRTMNEEDFEKYAPTLSMCYAYSLGYRDPNGVYHAPGVPPHVSFSQMPLMADRPPAEGIMSNSINHGLAGQNVLFADGHVSFLTTRIYGAGDDIYTNRDGKVGAGLDVGDIVLGYSSARP